jgi:hypothetical protein
MGGLSVRLVTLRRELSHQSPEIRSSAWTSSNLLRRPARSHPPQSPHPALKMTTMLKAFLGAGALICAMGAAPAFAQSLTGNVGSADVEKAEQGLEVRIGADSDNNKSSRAHVQYGFTDRYLLRVITSFRMPDGGDWEYSGPDAGKLVPVGRGGR